MQCSATLCCSVSAEGPRYAVQRPARTMHWPHTPCSAACTAPTSALARGRFSAPVAHCINRTMDGAASTETTQNRAHRVGQAGGLGSESRAGQWPESQVEREVSVTGANEPTGQARHQPRSGPGCAMRLRLGFELCLSADACPLLDLVPRKCEVARMCRLAAEQAQHGVAPLPWLPTMNPPWPILAPHRS